MPSRTQSLITVFTARRGEGEGGGGEKCNTNIPNSMRRYFVDIRICAGSCSTLLESREFPFSTRNNSRYVRLRFITRSLDFSSPVIFLYVHSKGIPLPRNHFGSFLLSFFFETEREIIEPCRIHAIFPSNSPRKKGENPRVVTVTG